MKAAVRSRTQLRNSFIHSAKKLQGGQNCLGRETDRVSPARYASEVDLSMIVARSERLVDVEWEG
jgi:hypothetical protein